MHEDCDYIWSILSCAANTTAFVASEIGVPGHGFRDVMRGVTFEYARQIALESCPMLTIPKIEIVYLSMYDRRGIYSNRKIIKC